MIFLNKVLNLVYFCIVIDLTPLKNCVVFVFDCCIVLYCIMSNCINPTLNITSTQLNVTPICIFVCVIVYAHNFFS